MDYRIITAAEAASYINNGDGVALHYRVHQRQSFPR